MTPAIVQAQKAKIAYKIHSYQHDAAVASYGLEAADKLGVDPVRVFKTLIAQSDDGTLLVAIVPVSSTLNLKALATATAAKRAQMADMRVAERATGYVAGGISPLGQKKRLRTILDESASSFATIFVSAGRRGLEIELAPADLVRLTNGTVAQIAQ